ncbi:MAG: hypothetical protein A2077_07100 [Nitrospirae bacterium GWC2_46_6]|nr:MAG: hypothetical protein A2Z82_00640 [Nitrospirae bacterium GWA2_46_11]OGW23042.1 MAG: hypothetical protein A2077_07100 [Nitrospirae bacterium GWC2_46_6]OGW23865.1 MAG: hypothetical protein A2X55_05445 [Nitrospirae bacterium GWB2_47_37]HAK88267.1 hypothetical protein [Nitrospiraceae bacterium]HCL81029.1 hypothetical protein [Nitrospiraceae bacterium]
MAKSSSSGTTINYQVQGIKKSVKAADRPDAKFVDHEKVAEWLDSWGTEKELKSPQNDNVD